MQRDQDSTTGATYFTLRDGPVVATIHVTDLIMVDVDKKGRPVGVEFAVDPDEATPGELSSLWTAYPALRKLLPLGRPQRPQDTNRLAFAVVAEAVGETTDENSTWSATGFPLYLIGGVNQFNDSSLTGNSFEPTDPDVKVS